MVDNLFGNKAYQNTGRRVLPILVRQAESRSPISYESLAREIGMPNERNLNYPLGSIGITLQELAHAWENEIPHIQSLVISKRTGLPGSGFDGFLEEKGYGGLTSHQKRRLLISYYTEVFEYPFWGDVLEYCELERKHPSIEPLLKEASLRSGGESPAHAALKEYVRTHPHVIGLSETHPHGEAEYELPSGDIADVVFSFRNHLQIAEVKSLLSDAADITLGLFQCIKYKSVLEALTRFRQRTDLVDVCLVLGGTLPDSLIPLRNCLGISVIENLTEEG